MYYIAKQTWCKTALPKLLWIATHLKILWESLDPLNKIEYHIKICFENHHGHIYDDLRTPFKIWGIIVVAPLLMTCIL